MTKQFMSPTEIKNLMGKYGIAPKKLFGQNFLISEGILDKIVKAANLSKNDTVLEVGPGLGVLTFKLAPLAKQIIAVEKDRNLVKILGERLAEEGIKNVEIIEEDILKFSITNFQFSINDLISKFSNYKLIANIPYYLTSVLIRKFLESENKPAKIILMIQKEVAQRICIPKNDGRPTSINKMNLLALSVQFYADAKILFYVSKENFWPAPKVDSAVIEITPKEKLPDVDEKLFFKVVRAGFANKRKQLAPTLARNLQVWGRAGNLSQNLKLPDFCHPELVSGSKLPYFCHSELVSGSKIPKEKIEELLKSIGLNPKIRAEELGLGDWIKLIKITNASYRL